MLERFSDMVKEPLNELKGSSNELLPDFFKGGKEFQGDSGITKAFNFDNEKSERIYNELCKSPSELQFDDIGLKDKSHEMGNPEFISEIRDKYENIDKVIGKYENILNNPDASIQEKMSANRVLDQYKGTVFEAMLKELLKGGFLDIVSTQVLVQTDLGGTKPDIQMIKAKTDIQIDGITIKQHENLGIEVKCGSADYIYGQMEHINKQIRGLGPNALVVVSKDYLDLKPEQRAKFEKMVSDNGAGLYVADVYSADVMTAIQKSKGA